MTYSIRDRSPIFNPSLDSQANNSGYPHAANTALKQPHRPPMASQTNVAVRDNNPWGEMLALLNSITQQIKMLFQAERTPLPEVPTVPKPVPVTPKPDTSANKTAECLNNIKTGFNSRERQFGEPYETRTYADAIKLMMMTFGQRPTDCFDKVSPSGDGYDITMKDGYELYVSGHEINRAGQAVNFTGTDREMIKNANFIFAAFTKRYQQSHEDPVIRADFETALDTALTHGRQIKPTLENLGMIAHMRHVHVSELEEDDTIGYLYGAGLVLGSQWGGGDDLPYQGHGYVLDNASANSIRLGRR
ncbi:hypothetical protein ACI77M_22925 [Pseudomonas fildesensis]|uniref:hypothetical protein n=1 Tax=Pseudomonas fildesensis TaxID=1674920 RepID=UPI00387A86E4